MRLLLDSCVWGGVAPALRSAGHDVVWAGDWKPDPGDDEILARAHGEGRVLVTLDKDFGELAVLQERPHAGIVRLVNLASQQQVSALLRLLESHPEALGRGAIVTVGANRLRIRRTGA